MEDVRPRTLTRLLAYARSQRAQIWCAATFSFLNKVLDLAPPALIGLAIDCVVQRESSWLGSLGVTSVMGQVWIVTAATVVIFVFESLTQYVAGVGWRRLSQDVEHALRVDAWRHVQGLELGFFEDRSSGELMSVLNDDVNQLERFLDVGAEELIQVATTVLVVGVSFCVVSPSLALLAMLPMPLIVWGSVRFQRRLAPRYADVRERAGLLGGRLANDIGGIATIQSFTAEQHELDLLAADSEAYRDSNRRAIKLSAAFTPLIRMVILSGLVATLAYGAWLVGEDALSAGAYGTVLFLTQRLLWPLTRLGATFDLYQRAMASARRILDLIAREPRLVSGSERIEHVRGDVAFEDVDFSYVGGTPILETLSLAIPAGSMTAVVGSTGSGKTTLVKLLLRFYDVTRGRVTVDGHDLRSVEQASLRNAIGLVSQDVFLFHGSVRDNIAYGKRGASRAEVEEAARLAEAHDFIVQLPRGYDTIVGERGQKLSGGQRQRISIARAILKDPRILVLDEATSAVDNETEAAIQRSLARVAVGRTTIVIAHRLSTVRHADRIHVLERGRLVESGRHDDLVEAGGVYAALWRVQTGLATTPAG